MARRATGRPDSLRRLGEFGLIQRVRARCMRPRPRVRTGIGDDAAVLRPTGGDLLITTDLLVEGVHFDFRHANPYPIGAKAILVNASDIAAMGGSPETVLVSLAAPSRTRTARVDELYRGLLDGCRAVGADLVGGDTSSSPGPLFLNIVMTGSSPGGKAVLRSGGRPGNLLYVTGTLGDSRAGLRLLRKNRKTRPRASESYLIRRHLCPTPRIFEGKLLARFRSASAMIDISDGLASDVRHLCEESGTGARLKIAGLPVSEPLLAYCEHAVSDPLKVALIGGEDYELLFAVPPRRVGQVESWIRAGVLNATRIGSLTRPEEGLTLEDKHGRVRPLKEKGFVHF